MQKLHKTLLGQFAFLENIRNMPCYDWLCPTKQLTHLFLRQPNCVAIGLHLNPMVVVCLVYDKLLIHVILLN